MGVGIALLITAGVAGPSLELPAAGWWTGAACILSLAWFWHTTRTPD